MFVRSKNTELGSKYGPDSAEYDQQMESIKNQKIEGYINEKELEKLKTQRGTEGEGEGV